MRKEPVPLPLPLKYEMGEGPPANTTPIEGVGMLLVTFLGQQIGLIQACFCITLNGDSSSSLKPKSYDVGLPAWSSLQDHRLNHTHFLDGKVCLWLFLHYRANTSIAVLCSYADITL